MHISRRKHAISTEAFAREFPVSKGEWSIVELIPHLNHSVGWPPSGPTFNDSERGLEAFSVRFVGIRPRDCMLHICGADRGHFLRVLQRPRVS
jgi:hypothetical protein